MTPEAATFEIQKLVAAALVAFALGVAGNVITFYLLNRRDFRDLDRETKRLALWKAMRELKEEASEKTGLSAVQVNALGQRFKEEVQTSVDLMMGWKEVRTYLVQLLHGWQQCFLLPSRLISCCLFLT